MSGTSGYPTSVHWDEMPEEAMARAEEQLAALSSQAGGFWANYGGWMIFFVAVASIVALMLIYLAGKYRREREAGYPAQTSPLFDEVIDDTLESNVPFDTVHSVDSYVDVDDEYEDAPAHDNELVEHDPVSHFADFTDEAEEGDAEPVVAQEPLNDKSDVVADADDEEDEEDAEHVVTELPREDAESPRYAFATTRPEGAMNATFVRPEAPAETFREALQSTAAAVGVDDAGRPFIAPFIREDIDRAEMRQSERIDGLRDEVSRQVETLKSEQASRLDLVIAAIDRKLESLDRRQQQALVGQKTSTDSAISVHVSSLGEQVDRISSAIDGHGQRIRAITTILENRFSEVGKVHDEVKVVHSAVNSVRTDLAQTIKAVGVVHEEMDEVKEHVGRLERAILDRAAQDSATTVRLTDVIRGTLSEGSYTFGVTLANGETADCLIEFDGFHEKIAVDAGFPMEAFHGLPSRDAVRRNLPQAKVAEDGFRRAILRAILEAAGRCISPVETADSCILFLPSEAAYTILHDRFPDLVRDSQRARVWLVSPSTLMGALNLLRNLLPDAPDLEAQIADAQEAETRRDEEVRLRQEVDALRRRATGLADELDRTRGTLRDLIGPTTERHDLSNGQVEVEPAIEVPSDSDAGIIEGLRFEGTPDWQPSTQREKRAGSSSLFDDDRSDTLR